MRSTVVVTTLLILAAAAVASTAPTISPDEATFDKEFSAQLPADDDRKGRLTVVIDVHAKCKEWRWSCQKACRAQVPLRGNATAACTKPHPGETCFGEPINYNYVPSRESLPTEYEVLKRFPKCWSVLGPMLCGMIYRPCGVYDFEGRLQTSMTQMEIWQRFEIRMCRRVHEQCQDAITEGFFPSALIDCNRTAENVEWIKEKTNAKGSLARYVPSGNEEDLKTEWDRQTVFTEEPCPVGYGENASHHAPMQCIFPLVYTRHEKIAPVIDKCFLPCRNPLISSPDKFLSFRVIRGVLCAFFAALCLAIFMFLATRSRIYVESHAIFAVAWSLLAFSIYLAFFGLGSIGFMAEASECTRTAQGVDIRSAPIDLYGSMWCTISAIVLHVSALAAIGFLAAAFPLSAAAASKAAAREDKKEQKKSDDSSKFRARIGFGVLVASLVAGLAGFFLRMTSTDGVAGVCSVGLHSIVDHLTAVAIPGLVACLIALGLGVRDIWREKKQREADVEHAIEEKIREAVDHEKAKEKFEFWTERGPGQKEDIQQQLRRPLPPLEERTEASGSSQGGGEIQRLEGEGEDAEKEALVTTLQGDEEEKEWLTRAQKQEIAETVRREQREELRGEEKRAWYEGISSRYTLVALCACMGSLIFGLCVHYVTLANDGRDEYEAIRAYVTCVLSKSIVRKDTHWMRESVHAAEMWREGTAEADPLVRRHNLASEITIHSCAYPSSGDGRLFGVLAVFVLLPLLPICVFIWAFGAGITGLGGMASVLTRRPKEAAATDVEMTALSTGRDEDSQMMSSAGSSLLGSRSRLVPAPSSTASTYLSLTSSASDASSVSSTRSISLRGALPRFPSRERVRNVRATSPVPSQSRSEVVAVPERRARSVGHHRVLDVMGRARERRERSRNKKKKSKTSLEEMEARREGVAETGQLVPAARHAEEDDDARSDHSEVANSAVSSTMVPPSEIGRTMMRNAALLMAAANRSRQCAPSMQQQLQLIQEELLVRAQPMDEENGVPQPRPPLADTWLQDLNEVRTRLSTHCVVSDAANVGMRVSGEVASLGRTMTQLGTGLELSNLTMLQVALEQLQGLALHLEAGLNPPREMEEDLALTMEALASQREMNMLDNRREALQANQLDYISLDVNAPEVAALRAQYYNSAALSDEERASLLARMLTAQNRRYILRMVARTPLGLVRPVVQQPQLEQQHLQGGGSRPPVYAPMYVVDTTQPPTPNGAASEASFSVTNSSVPSSSLTVAATREDEDHLIRMYWDTRRLPPGYDGPSTSAAAGAANENTASSSSATTDVGDFCERVNRANGHITRALLTAARPIASFDAPMSSELGSPSNNGSELSSVNSMDTIDRHRQAQRAAWSQFPVHSVEESNGGASSSRAPPAAEQLRPRLFGFVNPADGPQVGRFPGAQPNGQLFVTREDQQQSLVNGLARLEVHSAPLGGPPTAARNGETNGTARREERKRKEPVREEAHHAQAAPRDRDDDRYDDDMAPPPSMRRAAPPHPQARAPPPLKQDDDDMAPSPPRRVASPQVRAAPTTAPADVRGARGAPLRRGATRGLAVRGAAAVGRGRGGGVGRAAAAAPPAVLDDNSDNDDGLMEADGSGLNSIENLRAGRSQVFMASGHPDDLATARPLTSEEFDRISRTIRAEMERRVERAVERRLEQDEEEAGPSNDAARRQRLLLRNRYQNHSDPDLAMADEERELERQRLRDEEREEEERLRVVEARERARLDRLRQREQQARGPRDFGDLYDPEDEDSLSSLMTSDEQAELVVALRHALGNRQTDGLSDKCKRLVEHLLLALDTQGGISREEIMRFRVNETNLQNRERQQPDRNSPYSVSSVVVSRMSLAEIGARVDAIRRYSPGTLYPLEIYYQLHLADVLWPLAGRDVVLGDNVYTHDEINRVLGTDTPIVPPDADSEDFHQLMRKRAITAASLTGRAYGRDRGTDGFVYQPPRLPDMDVYRTLGGPAALIAAIDGDFQPLLDAIQAIQLTMPDVMRLDNRSAATLGTHLRRFRDYLDEQATAAGYPLRPDTYANDVVPPEPTGSRDAPPPPPPGRRPQPDDDDEDSDIDPVF